MFQRRKRSAAATRKNSKPRTNARDNRPIVERLPARILLSADLPGLDLAAPDFTSPSDYELMQRLRASVLNHVPEPHSTEQVDTDTLALADDSNGLRLLVVVDSRVTNYQQLIEDITNGAVPGTQLTILVIEAGEDGLSKVSEQLDVLDGIDAIHLFSHSGSNSIDLGTDHLTLQNLQNNAAQLKSWQGSLTDDADILFYGCDLAGSSDGVALINEIAELTGADVAASDDTTGTATAGGDWDLEYHTGTINSAAPISLALQDSYASVLGTFTVLNTNDSGADSLRQAIINANAAGGADTIEFNIAGGGPHVIELSTALPAIDGEVFIDGTSEPDYIVNGSNPIVVIDGNGLNANGLSITANADNSEIRGLVVRDFTGNAVAINAGADNVVVAGNFLGSFDTDGLDVPGESMGAAIVYVEGGSAAIGGNTSADRNIIAGGSNGVLVSGVSANGTQVSGNFIGVDVTGNSVVTIDFDGIRVENNAFGVTIGGATPEHGNLIAGVGSDGIEILGEDTDLAVVQNNTIGVSASGLINFGVGTDGVFVRNGPDNVEIIDNLIVGARFVGIEIDGDSNSTLIQGNVIGTDATLTFSWGSGENGILLENNANNSIVGGTAVGKGNVVAFSGANSSLYSAGVAIQDTSTGNTVLGNAIYGNRGAGIDLSFVSDDGVDANDSGDGDTGGNNKQNSAVFSSVSISSTGDFTYDIDTSTLNGSFYAIDFYASDDLDNGEVEGKRYLTSTTVAGGSSATATLSGVVLMPGEYVTLTVTDAGGNTSEFSNYAVAKSSTVSGASPDDLSLTTTSNGGLSINQDGGNDAYLQADDGGALLGGLTSFTIEAKLTLDSSPSFPYVLDYAVPGEEDELNLLLSGDTVRFTLGGIGVSFAGDYSLLRDGESHTISVSWDGSTSDIKLYIDGALQETVTGFRAGYSVASGGTLTIGNDQETPGANFQTIQSVHGTLFDIRVFDQVRSDAQILLSHDRTLRYDEAGMLANWQFDSLSTYGVVTDSVAANNLTLLHIAEPGFSASSAALILSINENALNGTVVGSVIADDPERDALIATLLANNTELYYNAETQKFYQYVDTGMTWVDARNNALAMTLNGVSGDLVTIDSATENQQVVDILKEYGAVQAYLLASDFANEGEWRQGDLATDIQFWQGNSAGFVVNDKYVNWVEFEPSNFNGTQHYAMILASSGLWDDADVGSIEKSIVEFDADAVLDNAGPIDQQPLLYSIIGQSIGGAFTIDASAGTISVADSASLDFESLPVHVVMVRVTDIDGNTYDEAVSITINDLGSEPTQTLPGAQVIADTNANLVFSAANGNAVSVSDTAQTSDARLQVFISVNDGVLTLSQTTGISILGGSNGSTFMTLHGSESDINAAFEGMVFTPDTDFSGAVTLQMSTSLGADMVGHYIFDGGNAVDQSVGLSQNGTLKGDASTVIDGARGEVLSLDGTADYVQISGLLGEPANVTLAAWINSTSTDIFGAVVVSMGSTPALYLEADGTLTGFYESGGMNYIIRSTESLLGTGWRHVALTIDTVSQELTVYIDGSAIETTVAPVAILYDDNPDTFIGRSGDGQAGFDFGGSIDDVRIYSRALSEDEVIALSQDATSVSGSVPITINSVNEAPKYAIPGQSIFTFGSDGYGQNKDTYVLSDGSMLIAPYDSGSDSVLVKLNENGGIDTAFGVSGYADNAAIGYIQSITVDSVGNILVAGISSGDAFLARYDSGGVLDTGFGIGGVATIATATFDELTDIAIQSDGGIVVVGENGDDSLIARFLANGTLDTSFGTDGIVTVNLGGTIENLESVSIDISGNIIAAGEKSIVRLTDDGSFDLSFDTDGIIDVGTSVVDLILQSDGKIVAVGTNGSDFQLNRYNDDGTVDTSFGIGGIVTWSHAIDNVTAKSIIQQTDGKLVVAGQTTGYPTEWVVVRTNADGSLDTSFGTNGAWAMVGSADYSEAFSVSLYNDGSTEKIIIGGYTTNLSDGAQTTLVRLNSNGKPDTMFGSNTLDGNPTFTEGAAAVVLDADAVIYDAELSGIDNFNGSSLTLIRNGGASTEDTFSATGTLATLNEGVNNLVVDSTTIGSVTTNSSGTLVLTFNSNATNASVNDAIQQIAYSNGSDSPPLTVQIDWTFDDGGDSVITQGGAAMQVVGSTTVDITAVNDNPVVTFGGGNVSYIEDATAIFIDASATVTDADLADFNGGVLLVSLTANGSTDDRLRVNNEGMNAGEVGMTTVPNEVYYGGVLIGTWLGSGAPLSITFNASADAAAVEAVAQNITFENLSDDPSTLTRTVQFVLTDGDGGVSASITKSISVIPLNDAPVITSDGGGISAAINIAESQTATTTVTATDIDAGDVLIYAITGGADAALFGMDANSGVLTFNTAPDFEAPSDSGADNVYDVTVQVDDQNGGIATQNIAVTVVNINQLTAVDDTISTHENTPLVFDPTSNDTDDDGGAISTVEFTQPSSGVVTDNGDGTLTYTPNAGFSGADSFEYVAINANANLQHYWALNGDAADAIGSAHGTLTGTNAVAGKFGDALNFNEVGDHVTIPDITYGSEFTISFDFKVDEINGSLFQYLYSHGDVNSTDSINIFIGEDAHGTDPNVIRTIVRDNNDTLDNSALQVDISSLVGDTQWHTYTLTSGPTGLAVYIDGVSASNDPTRGTDGVNPTGILYLGAQQGLGLNRFYGGGLDSLQIFNTALSAPEIQNFGAAQHHGTVNITVNDVPDFTSSSTFGVSENSTAVSTLTSADIDGGAPLYTLIGTTDDGLFDLDINTGVLAFSTATNFEVPIDVGSDNIYNITVQVDDQNGGLGTQNIAITVSDINEAPILVAVTNNQIVENTDTSSGFSVGTLLSVDPDAGDTFTYSIVGGTDAGVFSVGGVGSDELILTDGVLDFENQPSYTVTIRTTDSGGLSVDQALIISVTDQAEAPIFSSTAILASTEDLPYSYSITTMDPDTGDSLTISAPTLPSWLTLTDNGNGTATLAGTPTNTEVGPHTVSLQVSDGTLQDTQNFTITVTNVNDAPVIDLDADDSAAAGIDFSTTWTEGSGPVLITDSDATLSDLDSTNLTLLTVTLTNLLDDGNEFLTADTTSTLVVANYDAVTGVLTLSGSDTVANYQQVLRTVTYDNTFDHSNETARIITFEAYDGTDTSNIGTTTLTVVGTEQAGVTITAIGTQGIGEQTTVSELHAGGAATYLSQSVAVGSDGSAVVVWVSDAGQDGDGSSIMARLIDEQGNPIGNEFVVNSTGTGSQIEASVAIDASGNFVVVWTSMNQDGDSGGIYAQRFDSGGVPLGGEFLVNTTTAGSQTYSSIAMADSGEFVIAWSGNGVGDTAGVFAQRFDANGIAQGGEFRINETTVGTQNFVEIAADGNGNFVATWTSRDQDGSGRGVYMHRFDSNGNSLGGEQLVNTFTTGDQWISSVAMNDSGKFVIGWRDDAQAGELYMQLFHADGLANGSEIQVPSAPTPVANYPQFAMDDAGNVTAVWEDQADADDYAIVARQFDSSGTALGAPFLVNTHEQWHQEFPAISMNGDGQFVVVFTDFNTIGGESVEMRRFGGATTESGGTTNFAFVLDTVPTADVTITLSMPDGTEGTLSTTTLTFTNANWNVAQVVMVNGVEDTLADGNVTHLLVTSVASSSDSNYNGLEVRDVNVTNLDNDPALDLDADNSVAVGIDYVVTWTENGGSVAVVDTDATLIDLDSATLASVTVTLTNVLDGSNEVLAVDTTGTSIIANYNSGTGVLLLSGSHRVEDYQQVLRTVTYNNASEDPDVTSRVVTFVASDGNNLSPVAKTTVNITAINDVPIFSSTPILTSIEDVAYSYNITTTDPDTGDTLTFTPSTLPTWLTLTDNGDGTATLAGTPTNANLGAHTVSLQISDGGLQDVQNFTITVTNVNDAPTITSNGGAATASINVDENQTAVTTVTATDVDATDVPIFTITGGADATLFDVDLNTGVLTFNTAPSIETFTDSNNDGVYEVEVTADDGNNGTDIQLISVTVTDINEAPTLVAISNSAVIENTDTSGGFSVGTLTSADVDSGDTFTYSIIGGLDANVFSIGGVNSDELVLIDGVLDFESQPSYAVTIRTIDSGGLTVDQALVITVTDVNESPSFTSTDVFVSTEDVAYSYNITTTDPDSGDSLTIAAPTLPAWLTLTDNANGTATLVGTPTNADVGSHTVSLQVSDGNLLDTQNFTITVTNVGDAPTIISDGGAATASINVDENQTAVTTVVATDVDVGDVPTFTITGGADAALFGVDLNTGVLIFNTAPDFEAVTDTNTDGVYEVEITANDGNTGTDTQLISVTVSDVNEAPTVVTISNSAVTENTDTRDGYSVGTLTGTDADAGYTFVYSIVGGADEGLFNVGGVGSDELILTDGVLDFENQPSYTVIVRTTDSGGLDHDVSLIITVTDQNETPSFSSTAILTSTEDVPYSYNITTTDPESGDSLTITDVALPGWLALNDNGDGTATLSGTPSNTEVGSHNVSLQVSDGTLQDTQSFTLTVSNVNDASIITSEGGAATASVNVSENQTTVTTVVATDVDAGDVPTFTITGGVDAALFRVDLNTGVLTFNTSPDFETRSDANADGVYEVEITADDGNTGIDTQLISVTVTNINEAPPMVSLSNRVVFENTDSTSGFSVGTLTSTDVDVGRLFAYSIVGGADAGVFSIGGLGSDELILTDGVLNFESQPSYSVTVRTTDSAGLTVDQIIVITVIDQNEFPIFSSTPTLASTENVAYSYNITTTDPDTGGMLTITDVALPAWLTLIDNGDGTAIVSGTPSNAEVGLHTVSLHVSDGSLQDTQSFTLAVSNVNDAPVITSGDGGTVVALTVPENEMSVTTVIAIDADANDSIVYSITGGDDAGLFQIDAITGFLSFTTAQKFESATDNDGDGVYEVEVSASDSDAFLDSQQLFVTVTAAPELGAALAIEPTTQMLEVPQTVAPTFSSSAAVEQTDTEENEADTGPDPDRSEQLIDERELANPSFPINSLPFDFPIRSISALEATVEPSVVKSEANSSVENRLVKLLRVWNSALSQSGASLQDDLDKQRFSDELSRRMDDYDEQVESEVRSKKLVAQVATGLSLSLTAGFVSWVLRAGAMIASLLTSMPAWRQLDLLPILSAHDDEHLKDIPDDADENNEQTQDEKDEERVDSLLRKSG